MSTEGRVESADRALGAARVVATPVRGRPRMFLRRHGWPLLLVAPVLVLLGLLLYVPLAQGLGLSFFDYSLLIPKAPAWVGLDNYVEALRDPALWAVAGQTILWVVASIGFAAGSASSPRSCSVVHGSVGRSAGPGSWARSSWSRSSPRPRSPCSSGSTCTPSRGPSTACSRGWARSSPSRSLVTPSCVRWASRCRC